VLFTSYTFVFAFLPLALAGFFGAAWLGGRGAAGVFLVAASLVFYSWWDVRAVPLLAASIAGNYGLGRLLVAGAGRPRVQSWTLGLGIAANIAALIHYKYLAWLLGLAGAGSGLTRWAEGIALPLGISFFTFTQILFLVDCRDGLAKRRGPLDYCLFVTFFPHLIAGPILHHRDMMPQFADPETYRFRPANLAAGLGVFVVGMLKKCVVADPTGAGVAAAFAAPQVLSAAAAWQAALSYSMQLYFDFSGYSDMAIGLGLMFNVRLPLNFNSPYKAPGIIVYWQRWHITLTRTITLLLYNPLALWIARRRAARAGATRGRMGPGAFAATVAVPTFATMAVAGVWHGAGAQFLVFGLLHAACLTANHAWRIWRPQAVARLPLRLRHVAGVVLTYLAVLIASVFFRAGSVGDALAMLAGMAGLHPHPAAGEARAMAGAWAGWVHQAAPWIWLGALYAIVWFAPNTQEIFAAARPALDRVAPAHPARLRWRPSGGWAVAMGLAGVLAVLAMGGGGEFLYFKF
jgi:D-alanyl-lipoteichoic acid acyltransferase DltB (MBOAT superfamily)